MNQLSTRLVDAIIARAQRTPYAPIYDGDDLYMERFWLVKPSKLTFGLGVRVHHIIRSDKDRALHTHPWWFVSWIMRGTYWEILPADAATGWVGGYANVDEPFMPKQRKAGSIAFRGRHARHKVMLFRGPVWTLVLTGPDHGSWGFHVPGKGLVDRLEYSPRGANE